MKTQEEGNLANPRLSAVQSEATTKVELLLPNELLDELSGWHIEVLQVVIVAGRKGITAPEIAAHLEIKAGALNQRLIYLLNMKMLRRRAETSSAGYGRTFRYFSLLGDVK